MSDDHSLYYHPLTTELSVPRGAQPLGMAEAPTWSFSCGGIPGVNLGRARVRGGLDDLDMGSEPIFLDGKSKIAYRHKADGPGQEVYTKQMNALYTKGGNHLPIPRRKVVQQVAQFVSWFIKKESERQIKVEQYLRFGPGYLTLDQLYLLELKQISAASFQVILGTLLPQPILASTSYTTPPYSPEGFEQAFGTFLESAYYPLVEYPSW